VTLVASVALGSIAWLSILLVSLAMGGALAYDGPFWASASRAMPVALAGWAMGLINALGNLGRFLGPSVACSRSQRRQLPVLLVVLGVALLLAGPVMLTVRGRANPATQAATASARA
jgi:hypothetical protein